MKRLASWLRQLANEIDPPAKRGRPSRRAERNAAAVDALFANPEEAMAAGYTGNAEFDRAIAEHEVLHGWPEEPVA